MNSSRYLEALGSLRQPIPRICFGTSALGNVNRVIPEQSKLEICGAWFQDAQSPAWVDASYQDGDGLALEVLARMLRRLDVSTGEILISLRLDGGNPRSVDGAQDDSAAGNWERSYRLLGEQYRPRLVSASATNASAWRFANKLKADGLVKGVGAVISDLRNAASLALASESDWVMLTGGYTLMRQQPEAVALIDSLASRQIPIVLAGVLEGGFLVGGNHLDGRPLDPIDVANRALFAWRKAFVALCDGHGIRPAHACMQFALANPGIAAVRIESSYADRVAENIKSVQHPVPAHFWASMKEEGLLPANFQI